MSLFSAVKTLQRIPMGFSGDDPDELEEADDFINKMIEKLNANANARIRMNQ